MTRFTESRVPQHVYESMPSPTYGDATDEASQEPAMKSRKPITDSMEAPSRPTRFEKEEYAKLIDKINLHEPLPNFTEPKPSLIKDALVMGHQYRLLTITTVESQWGSKFIWRLKDIGEDTPPLDVYGTEVLNRYVTKNNNQLDPVKVNCLKEYRIIYYGYLNLTYGRPNYQFTISM